MSGNAGREVPVESVDELAIGGNASIHPKPEVWLKRGKSILGLQVHGEGIEGVMVVV